MEKRVSSLCRNVVIAAFVLSAACSSNNSPDTKSASGSGGNVKGGASGQGGQSPGTAGAAGSTSGAGGQAGKTSQQGADAALSTGGTGGVRPGDTGADALGGGDSGTSADGAGLAGAVDVAVDARVVGNPRRLLLCDEGNRAVHLLDFDNPSAGWTHAFKTNDDPRDLQLVGNDRVAVCIDGGYAELDIKTGEAKKEVRKISNVHSFRRLANGNTVFAVDQPVTTLLEWDSQDNPVPGHNVTFPNQPEVRIMRRTPSGTFLLGGGNKAAEVNWDKQTLWEMSFSSPGHNPLFVYQPVRMADGTIAVTTGFGATLVVFDPKTKTTLLTIGGDNQPEAGSIQPSFYAGFQILANGHYVVTNWIGHGPGGGVNGIQLLEYDTAGKLVWKWKQDPKLVSSLHQVIVLDGLDTTKFHDDVNGILAPATM